MGPYMTVIFGLWCKVQTKKNRIIFMIRFLRNLAPPARLERAGHPVVTYPSFTKCRRKKTAILS
ncbi:hypothetical protein BCS94_18260 [Vibrio breoganii]|nr:hypothetical protein BCS94_18260 [Vibrio breoganii]